MPIRPIKIASKKHKAAERKQRRAEMKSQVASGDLVIRHVDRLTPAQRRKLRLP